MAKRDTSRSQFISFVKKDGVEKRKAARAAVKRAREELISREQDLKQIEELISFSEDRIAELSGIISGARKSSLLATIAHLESQIAALQLSLECSQRELARVKEQEPNACDDLVRAVKDLAHEKAKRHNLYEIIADAEWRLNNAQDELVEVVKVTNAELEDAMNGYIRVLEDFDETYDGDPVLDAIIEAFEKGAFGPEE